MQTSQKKWAKLKAFEPFFYDRKWLRWREDRSGPVPQFVALDGAFRNTECWAKLKASIEKRLDYDVIICGGTFGIIYAPYLQQKGYHICVAEAGPLCGQKQEWNISVNQLFKLVEAGVLLEQDIKSVIRSQWPGRRAARSTDGGTSKRFGYESFSPQVLTLGLSPAVLIDLVAKRFLGRGEQIMERTQINGVCVSDPVGCAMDLDNDTGLITAKLVLDCMGNGFPIAAQQRYGMKPDKICAVVGSCAGGYGRAINGNSNASQNNLNKKSKKKNKGSNQYFWEEFPVQNDSRWYDEW